MSLFAVLAGDQIAAAIGPASRPRGPAPTVDRLVKVLLLVNPFSSSVTARTRVVIRKALAGDHEVELVETARRGELQRTGRDRQKIALLEAQAAHLDPPMVGLDHGLGNGKT